MTERDHWHWGISNPGPRALFIWLEPWTDEIEVPSKSTATLRVNNAGPQRNGLLVEDTGEHIVIWASEGDCVEVYVDHIRKDTASTAIPVPAGLELPPKKILEIMFADHPEARLAGRRPTAKAPSIWKQLFRRR